MNLKAQSREHREMMWLPSAHIHNKTGVNSLKSEPELIVKL